MMKKFIHFSVLVVLNVLFINASLWAQATTYYTVNSALPTGGTNYHNFTDLTNDLNANGITSPVVIDVVPGSGPYTDTIHFKYIDGASPTNTIRINGHGEHVKNINYTPGYYYYNYILILDSTKYLTVDSLVFKVQDTSVNNYYYGGNGAFITGWAEYDSITNCVFDFTRDSSWWYGGYGNSGAITLGGSDYYWYYYYQHGGGRNCYVGHNYIVDSTDYYGTNYYYSTYMGIALFKGSDNNIIEHNAIKMRTLYDIYLSGGKNNKILYNDISRMNDSVLNYYYGNGHYGIYTTDTIPGTKIIGNRIHGISYNYNTVYYYNNLWGLCLNGVGTANNPVLVANNAVYNNQYKGSIIGIQIQGGYNKVYSNTIAINKTNNFNFNDYGIKVTNAVVNPGIEIKNNNVSITGGSAGDKYGFYYEAIVADAQKNNFYVNSTQTGGQLYGYYFTDYPTQASFQASIPGLEIGSPTADPQYEDPTIGNLSVNSMALKGQGVDLSAEVPLDILENPRPQLPTIGAFEAVLAKNDAATDAFVSPADSFCPSSQPIRVVIYNAGVNDIHNMEVHWTIDGTLQPTVYYSDTLHSIASTAGHFSDTVLLGNVFIGSSTATDIKVWTDLPNGVADTVNSNDTIERSFKAIPTNFSIASDLNFICPSVSVHLNLSPDTGYIPGQFAWQYSDNGVNWTDIPNADSTSYTDTNMNTTKWYRVKIDLSGICYSDTTRVTVISPQVLSTQSSGICDSGSVVLQATSTLGTVLHWYNAPLSTTLLDTGELFSTPDITATHTFYVSAGINGLPACESSRTGVLATVDQTLPNIPLHDTIVCAGDTITLTAGHQGAEYLWNTGDTTGEIVTVDSGLYNVLITSEFGCHSKDSIQINWHPYADVNGFDFIPSFYPHLGTVAFSPIDPVAVEHYLWDFGDGTQDTSASPVHTYNITADYLVSLSVSNTCGTFTTSQMIHVDLTTGIVTRSDQAANVVLFPNPARNLITIKAASGNTMMTEFSIYDMLGRIVYEEQERRQGGVSRKQINLSGLASGVYTIKINTTKGNVIIRKFDLTD